MEESKYYTPDITEFHVGFEYEYRNEPYKRWKKGVFNDGESIEQFDEYRIKHLDKSDILSLGFKIKDFKYYDTRYIHNGYNIGFKRENFLNENIKGVYAKFIKSHMGGNYGLADEYIYIKHLPWNENQNRYGIYKLLYYGDSSAGNTQLFYGTIKNKSELKKLLTQIGVN